MKFFVRWILCLAVSISWGQPRAALDDIIVIREVADGIVLVRNVGTHDKLAPKSPLSEAELSEFEAIRQRVLKLKEDGGYLAKELGFLDEMNKEGHKAGRQATPDEAATHPNMALLSITVEKKDVDPVASPLFFPYVFFSGTGKSKHCKTIPSLAGMREYAFRERGWACMFVEGGLEEEESMPDSVLSWKTTGESDGFSRVMASVFDLNESTSFSSLRKLCEAKIEEDSTKKIIKALGQGYVSKFGPAANKKFHIFFKECLQQSGHTPDSVASQHREILDDPPHAADRVFSSLGLDLLYHSEQSLREFIFGLYGYWDGFPTPKTLHSLTEGWPYRMYTGEPAFGHLEKQMELSQEQKDRLDSFLKAFQLEDVDPKKEVEAPEMVVSLYVPTQKKMCPLCVTTYCKELEKKTIKEVFRKLMVGALSYKALIDQKQSVQDRGRNFMYFQKMKGLKDDPWSVKFLSRMRIQVISVCNGL